MRQYLKKSLSLLLTLIFLFGVIGTGFGAEALVSAGECGEGVSWSFHSISGELVIDGIGSMRDYGETESPFYGNPNIKSLRLTGGVTSVGDNAFRGCANLESITFSDAVNRIGRSAFEGCASLTELTINAQSIDSRAFAQCYSLKEVTFEKNVLSVGTDSFVTCPFLDRVNVYSPYTQLSGSSLCMQSFSVITLSEENYRAKAKSYIISYTQGDRETAQNLLTEMKNACLIYDSPVPKGTLYCHAGTDVLAQKYAAANAIDIQFTHFYSDWMVGTDGVKSRRCKVCGYEEIARFIEVTGDGAGIVYPEEEGVTFRIKKIVDPDDKNYVAATREFKSGFYALYRVEAVNAVDGTPVTAYPDFELRLPLTDEGKHLPVYFIDADGGFVQVRTVVTSEYMSLKSDTTGYYLMAQKNECKCICHRDSGIMALLAVLVRIFWKLTGTNQMCECGFAHYLG